MYRDTEYDVLIAGAGPAGVHTALRLARDGWRVALVDAREFPRKKPCGEFLSPACLPLLEELDLLEELRTVGAKAVTRMTLAASVSRALGDFVPLGPFAPSHGHGLGIRREVLDHQAVRAAQRSPRISVFLGWRVSAPILNANGRTLGLRTTDPDGKPTELRARITVGADGRRSRVARGLGWEKPRTGTPRFAIVARFTGVEESEEAQVHFVGSDYFAACPIDEGLLTANLVVDANSIPKGSAGLEQVFRERLRGAPAFARLLERAEFAEPLSACGPLRSDVRQFTGPGVALVGDACGFVDPLTGEGMFFAMRGAKLLAPVLSEALANPHRELAALRSYERSRRWEFGARYALARILQQGLRYPGVPERVIGIFERIPGLCDLMLGLTGDYVPPIGLASPRVWWSALRRRARPETVLSPAAD